MERTLYKPGYCTSCGRRIEAEEEDIVIGYDGKTGKPRYSKQYYWQCPSWWCRNLSPVVTIGFLTVGAIIFGGSLIAIVTLDLTSCGGILAGLGLIMGLSIAIVGGMWASGMMQAH